LTNKFNLIDRLTDDLIRFFDHMVVAYFLGHPVNIGSHRWHLFNTRCSYPVTAHLVHVVFRYDVVKTGVKIVQEIHDLPDKMTKLFQYLQ